MIQPYECKFCNKKFHKESSLASHLCVKKQRHNDVDTAGARLGFRTYQRYYELIVKSKKLKTQQEFIDSDYYIDFVKFGNHLALLKPIYIEKYIDFVIMNGVKLKDWTKDFVYDLYIEDLVKKEPAVSAAERTITEIMSWCEKNTETFSEFFIKVTANEAAYLIRTGKISPWVLYLCTSAENLMNKFSEEHGKIIGEVIEPSFWMRKFKKSTEDVEYIKSLLEQSGL